MNEQQFDELWQVVDTEILDWVADNYAEDGPSTQSDNKLVAHWLLSSAEEIYPDADILLDSIRYVIENNLFDDTTMNKLFCIWHYQIREQRKLANV